MKIQHDWLSSMVWQSSISGKAVGLTRLAHPPDKEGRTGCLASILAAWQPGSLATRLLVSASLAFPMKIRHDWLSSMVSSLAYLARQQG